MTVEAIPPTQTELLEEDEDEALSVVYRSSRDNWRHGCTITKVFLRETDQTHWKVKYRRQTDGEWDGLRENDYEICQAEPYEVITTQYRAIKR